MLSLIITIVITLLAVGLVLWGINSLPMISPTIKQIINVVVIVGAGLWILYTVAPYAHGFHRLS